MSRRAGHYVARTANEICRYIALGNTLEEALKKVGYLAPSIERVWVWIDEHQDFRDKYERARQLQADMHADRMLTFVDKVIDGSGPAPARYKVAMEILRWQAEVRNREKYGSKSTDPGKNKPLDPAKIRAEIKRLETELGVAETKVVPIKAVK